VSEPLRCEREPSAEILSCALCGESRHTVLAAERNAEKAMVGAIGFEPMSHAMAVLHGVIAKDGGLVCDSEALWCPHCGVVYHLHYSTETGPSQLQLFRYIASENIRNEHPQRHHTSIALGSPCHC
jgi:hypothetical protein